MTQKRGEVQELQEKLISPDIDQKQEGIRRIIDAMTRGKDVSMLFMDVLKNMETPSLQLKKLIYLYVMNYAKTRPELAIMGTNTFRKDASDKHNPFLRGLAVRTMGCIRIKDITGYLCDPLKEALKDEDAYVRKTSALCVPKLYQIDPQLIEGSNFLKILENLLNDGNATVVSNAIAALSICSELKGQPLLALTQGLVQKLLTAMNDCNQWGVVYILDTLSGYIPKNPTDAENTMERVSSKLAHTNSAVALSAIRLIIKYMDYLSHPDSIRAYNNKISAPLITMISRQSQISYLVLKTINLILQKRPLLLPKELKIFFVNYHDPLYVKLEKLEVLAKIASNENILLILHELKECVQEVDVEFVRRAVRTMGRCAIKLEKSADKCVQCLWETLKTKIPYVVQEAVIVIRDIFRKYPNKYEGLLADICENLKTLDDPEAKASIVWIIGEYVEMIDNADEILESFAQNFKDEPDVVQQQILLSCMKLYLQRPAQGTEILKDLFKYITKQCENPDLRDRGYLYWRMISTDPALAKKIVMSQRPLLTEQSYTLDTELLDKLIENIGFLATVYGKQPEDFVKRLKDNANAREVIDEDQDQLLKGVKENVDQADKPKQNVNFFNKEDNLLGDSVANVPNQAEMVEQPKQQVQPIDLLGDVQPQPPKQSPPKVQKPTDLIDLDQSQASTNVQSVVPQQQQQKMAEDLLFNPVATKAPQNILIPLVEAINGEKPSKNQLFVGLQLRAAFQREGPNMFLQMIFTNYSKNPFTGLELKINGNAFKLQVANPDLSSLITVVQPGETNEIKVLLLNTGNEGKLEGWPYSIQCGLKLNQQTATDIYIFKVPCSLSVAMEANLTFSAEQLQQMSQDPNCIKSKQTVKNQHNLSVESLVQKFQKNNLILVSQKDNGDQHFLAFMCRLTNSWNMGVIMSYLTTSDEISIQMVIPNESVAHYFHHALSMILILP